MLIDAKIANGLIERRLRVKSASHRLGSCRLLRTAHLGTKKELKLKQKAPSAISPIAFP
jgi:hypothetical protein